MAVDASAPRPLETTRARAVSPALVLGLLVAASFALRLLVVWRRAAPALFPDEYIYSELGRSLAAHGVPTIRGGSAHFPSLLAPLLDAPAWLAHDVLVGYRIVQALQALAMSLAAVPVYLLGRHLRLSRGLTLAAAAVAVAVPDFVYASYVVAEPFAYPLALGAVAAGVVALEAPTRRRHALFLALAALAALARIQFVVVPLAFAAAALALGLRERGLRRVLREQALPLGLFALGGAAVAVVGLGYYSAVMDPPALGAVAASAGNNLLVLAYAAGWTIVPGALLGLGLALARPLDRRELAFAALTVAFGLGILVQAAIYGSAVHERYLFYVVPLLALAFGAYARRGWPFRLYHGLLAAALLAAGTLVPLTNLMLRGEANAPTLMAVHWLTDHLGGVAGASTAVLWVAGAGTALLVAASRRPRLATAVALGFALVLGLAAWGLSADFDLRNVERVRQQTLPANRSWVDARRLGHVTLLQSFGGQRTDALDQLFWNRSVDRVAVLPGGFAIDSFSDPRVDVAADGSLSVAGRALRGPLLVDRFSSTVVLRGARPLEATAGYRLWRPAGTPRLALYLAGRSSDGWITPEARLNAWAARGSAVRFWVRVPAKARRLTLRVALPHGRTLTVALAAGRRRVVSVPVCDAGAWHAMLRFSGSGFVGDRVVSAKAGVPRLVPSAADCG